MKLAMSATGRDMDSELDPRFGRCPYFIIVDSDTLKFKVIDNSSSIASGGAGISAAQLIAEKNAGIVLTGSCGPNAFQALSGAKIEVITGLSGKISAVIEKYKSGELKTSSKPNAASHSGMSRGTGRGWRGGAGS